MRNAINSRLPKDIYIKKVEIVSGDFHARFSVLKKEYHYYIDFGEFDPLKRNYRYYFPYKKLIEIFYIKRVKYLLGSMILKVSLKTRI